MELWQTYCWYTEWGKIETIFSTFRDKSRMSILPIIILYSAWILSQSNKERERGRDIKSNAEVKLSICRWYKKDPSESTKRLLDLKNAISKAMRYKIYIKKSTTFYIPTMEYLRKRLGK
jgi:hypothetical protein